MTQSVETYIRSLGPVTRHVLVYVVVSAGLVSMGIVSPLYLVLQGYSLQLWRPFTAALFFGQLSIQFLMTTFMLATYLNNNETRHFANKPVDFLWMLFLLMVSLGGLGATLSWYLTSSSLLLALCWIFCKRNPADRIVFWGFEFSAAYFPWVLLVFNFMVSHSIYPELVGIAVGHLYVFLADIFPATHGRRLIDPPAAWYRLLHTVGVVNYTPTQPGRVPPPGGLQGHRWGTGRQLGA